MSGCDKTTSDTDTASHASGASQGDTMSSVCLHAVEESSFFKIASPGCMILMDGDMAEGARQMRERLGKIVRANPWLAGTLKKRGKEVHIVH
mmetsp:Transcript_41010/g.59943  ORF Transcript_41010/g.59943 Transcript_41010/m.59943 type:complete len:92 (-) Transcript_41010:1046-1321(-)